MRSIEPEWIRPARDYGDVVPRFVKRFHAREGIVSADLMITGLGVYKADLNGERIGDFVMAPGWTAYESRLQFQTYDVTDQILEGEENCLSVLLGKGWMRSRLVGWQQSETQKAFQKRPAGLLAELEICYENGDFDRIVTDESWLAEESRVRFSEIYDGELYDASFTAASQEPVVTFDGPDETLVEQEGPEVCEHERLAVKQIIHTPAGETVLDFGQEITGYVEIRLTANKGEIVDISFGEVLDAQGNFYNENYRSAKCLCRYICRDGEQSWKPVLTFYGFRYVRINEFPGKPDPASFTAIAVYSDLEQTGFLVTSDPLLNRLISNARWSQKDNFLDVPTDCPQRDERLGWTGDAQVFARTACYNFDCEEFFGKWLNDLAADQRKDGAVGFVIPDLIRNDLPSAAWGDAATIIPWEVYLAYGDAGILSRQFHSMKAWVDYITGATTTPFQWTGGWHFADWLGLDAPTGSYKGSTREDLIASAFYARSTELLIKAGQVLGKDMTAYQELYENIRTTFRKTYPVYETQTECVLAAHFNLAENPQGAADQLAQMIMAAGCKLQTGFVGTPYLLHVLSDYGYDELAWTLLLRKEYPSWLYPVLKGATTIWEHWDGIMEDGSFWSTDMNSFNHYAYGSVLDWLYGVAAGIKPLEAAPGYEQVSIAPHPDPRLGWLEARLETLYGPITSRWEYEADTVRYEITTPVDALLTIDGKARWIEPGSYIFFSLEKGDREPSPVSFSRKGTFLRGSLRR